MTGAEVGSPRFQALSDLDQIWYVSEEIGVVVESLETRKEGQSRIRLESNLRIAEIKFALLKQQIHTRETEIPGYALASYELNVITNNLRSAYEADVRSENPAFTPKNVQEWTGDIIHEDVGILLKKRVSGIVCKRDTV